MYEILLIPTGVNENNNVKDYDYITNKRSLPPAPLKYYQNRLQSKVGLRT
jgi:hypothetical protein